MKQLIGEKIKSNNRLFGLDHLRAFAISFVFIFHYGRLFPHPEWTNSISVFGWTGVDLFFVLSGYLISSQLFEKIAQSKKISFREFFLKRFFRIIPAYLVVLALYFLFPSFREREALAPLWKYLTFTQNIGLDLRTQGTFSHAWSLCIEEQFYLLLPLTLIVLVYLKTIKRGYLLLLFLFVIGFFARYVAWHIIDSSHGEGDNFWVYWQEWIYYPTYSRLDGLLTGVSLAATFQFLPKLKMQIEKYGNLLLLIGLIVLIAAYFMFLHQETLITSVYGFPLVSIGYGLIVAGAISPTSFLYKFNSRITSTLATLSYAVYLTHKIIIHLTQEYFSKLHIEKDSNVMFIISIATSLLAALLLNKIIEKPFLRLKEKILARK